jgi:hypothetical protein
LSSLNYTPLRHSTKHLQHLHQFYSKGQHWIVARNLPL